MIQFSRRDRACRIVRAALPGVEEDETNHALMPVREALEQANLALPGQRLHRFQTVCGPRGGCEQEPVIGNTGRWTW